MVKAIMLITTWQIKQVSGNNSKMRASNIAPDIATQLGKAPLRLGGRDS